MHPSFYLSETLHYYSLWYIFLFNAFLALLWQWHHPLDIWYFCDSFDISKWIHQDTYIYQKHFVFQSMRVRWGVVLARNRSRFFLTHKWLQTCFSHIFLLWGDQKHAGVNMKYHWTHASLTLNFMLCLWSSSATPVDLSFSLRTLNRSSWACAHQKKVSKSRSFLSEKRCWLMKKYNASIMMFQHFHYNVHVSRIACMCSPKLCYQHLQIYN